MNKTSRDLTLAKEANDKLKNMYNSNLNKYQLLFMTESELSELFEQ